MSTSSGLVSTLSLSLVIPWPSRECCHGGFVYLWSCRAGSFISRFFRILFVSSEGFRVLETTDGLDVSQRFSSYVSFSDGIASFRHSCCLGVRFDVLHWPLGCVSSGSYSSRQSWVSIGLLWSECLAVRDLCFGLFLTLRCSSGSWLWGRSCQPEHQGATLTRRLAHSCFLPLNVMSYVLFLLWQQLFPEWSWPTPSAVNFVVSFDIWLVRI